MRLILQRTQIYSLTLLISKLTLYWFFRKVWWLVISQHLFLSPYFILFPEIFLVHLLVILLLTYCVVFFIRVWLLVSIFWCLNGRVWSIPLLFRKRLGLNFWEELFVSFLIFICICKKLLIFFIFIFKTRIFFFQIILTIHWVIVSLIIFQSWVILRIQIMSMTLFRYHFTNLSIILMLRFYSFLDTMTILLLFMIVYIKNIYFSLIFKFKSFLFIFYSWGFQWTSLSSFNILGL